jgi:hypothetical protein
VTSIIAATFSDLNNTDHVLDDLLTRSRLPHARPWCLHHPSGCQNGQWYGQPRQIHLRAVLILVGPVTKSNAVGFGSTQNNWRQFPTFRAPPISPSYALSWVLWRSFLASFSTEVAMTKGPLRPLLSSKNPYVRTADHETFFDKVKRVLVHFYYSGAFWSRSRNPNSSGCITKGWDGQCASPTTRRLMGTNWLHLLVVPIAQCNHRTGTSSRRMSLSEE